MEWKCETKYLDVSEQIVFHLQTDFQGNLDKREKQIKIHQEKSIMTIFECKKIGLTSV